MVKVITYAALFSALGLSTLFFADKISHESGTFNAQSAVIHGTYRGLEKTVNDMMPISLRGLERQIFDKIALQNYKNETNNDYQTETESAMKEISYLANNYEGNTDQYFEKLSSSFVKLLRNLEVDRSRIEEMRLSKTGVLIDRSGNPVLNYRVRESGSFRLTTNEIGLDDKSGYVIISFHANDSKNHFNIFSDIYYYPWTRPFGHEYDDIYSKAYGSGSLRGSIDLDDQILMSDSDIAKVGILGYIKLRPLITKK